MANVDDDVFVEVQVRIAVALETLCNIQIATLNPVQRITFETLCDIQKPRLKEF